MKRSPGSRKTLREVKKLMKKEQREREQREKRLQKKSEAEIKADNISLKPTHDPR